MWMKIIVNYDILYVINKYIIKKSFDIKLKLLTIWEFTGSFFLINELIHEIQCSLPKRVVYDINSSAVYQRKICASQISHATHEFLITNNEIRVPGSAGNLMSVLTY